MLEADYLDHLGPDNPGEDVGWLTRWRDFVDAGLHVAAATDTPWIYPDFALTDTVGRPVDQIAGGMDGRGLANPETPDWVLAPVADRRAGAPGGDAGRSFCPWGRRTARPPCSRDAGRRHDPERGRTAAAPDEIRAMSVIATIVNGMPVHALTGRSVPRSRE